MIYVVLFLGLLLLLQATKNTHGLRDQMYFVVLLLLFLFSAFRFEVGCDWGGYLHQFRVQKNSDFSLILAQTEPLWWAIIQMTQSLELRYPWLNVFSSAIFFAGIHSLAKRQQDPLAFLIMLFPILIINMPMSAIRQGAAIGLLCIAFGAFIDKRMIKFVAFTFIASLLHSSAAVFLLLVPLLKGEYSKARLALAGVLAIPGFIFLAGGESGQVAVTRYINSDLGSDGAVFRVGLLMITGVFYFTVLRGEWARKFPKDFKLITIGALMMLALMILVPVSSVIGDRLSYYLIPLQAMIFARLPYLQMGRMRGLFVIAPYAGLFFVFSIWAGMSGLFQACYLPYQTWLFGFPEFSIYSF